MIPKCIIHISSYHHITCITYRKKYIRGKRFRALKYISYVTSFRYCWRPRAPCRPEHPRWAPSDYTAEARERTCFAKVVGIKSSKSLDKVAPKSSILIGISIINHPFWGYTGRKVVIFDIQLPHERVIKLVCFFLKTLILSWDSLNPWICLMFFFF